NCRVIERHVQIRAHEDTPAVDVPEALDGGKVTQELADPAGDQRGQVGKARRITPLVVVPADDLHLVALRHREQRVEGARRGRADDVTRNDRVLGVVEVALEL